MSNINMKELMGNSINMPALLKMKNIINKNNAFTGLKSSNSGAKSPNRSYFSTKYNI